MKTIEKTTTKSVFWAVTLFYFLIAFEFFYMASPFAVYFYSVYKPGLYFLDKFPAVSWITGFFLPHLVEETKSPVIDSLKITGAIIAWFGLLIFLICAFQVYYAKIFKKGVVKGGLYRYIRHPQYSAFALCSFGLLILWPRYLALFMYITLLFAYYILAKAEERECEKKFGENYLSYKKNTFMFLPVRFPFFKNRLHSNYPITKKAILVLGLYILSIFTASQVGKQIKRVSISSLYSVYEKNTAYVSITKMSEPQINELVLASNKSPEIQGLLKKAKKENIKLINYILPVDMYISEIPMIKPENASCHVYNNQSIATNYKIVYSVASIQKNNKVKTGKNILLYTVRLVPFIEVWVDKKKNEIIKIIECHGTTSRYENTPEPIF